MSTLHTERVTEVEEYCPSLTGPMFERENVPPVTSEVRSCPLRPRSWRRFNSTAISNTDWCCRGNTMWPASDAIALWPVYKVIHAKHVTCIHVHCNSLSLHRQVTGYIPHSGQNGNEVGNEVILSIVDRMGMKFGNEATTQHSADSSRSIVY